MISQLFQKLFASQLRRNISSGLIVSLINFTITAISYPIYLHYLGYEKYGIWVILSVVLTFAQFGNLGIGPALTKFVAEDYKKDNTRSVNEFVSTAIFTLIVSGGCVLFVILLFRTQIISLFKLDGENFSLALWLFPYVGLLSLYLFFVRAIVATLTGLGRMDLSNYTQTAGRIIGIVTAFSLLKSGFGVVSLLVAYFISEFFSHIICIGLIKRITSIRFLQFTMFDLRTMKKLVKFGGELLGANALLMLLTPFNKVMISRYVGIESVTVYEIAYNSTMYIRSIAAAGLQALMPEISRLSTQANSNIMRIRHIYSQSVKLISLLGIPLFAVVFVFATPLLKLWLQDGFNPILPMTFKIMLIGAFISLLSIPAHFTIMGLGYSGKIFLSHAIISTLNVIFVIIFIIFISNLSVNTFVISATLGIFGSTFYLLKQYNILVRHPNF